MINHNTLYELMWFWLLASGSVEYQFDVRSLIFIRYTLYSKLIYICGGTIFLFTLKSSKQTIKDTLQLTARD